MNQRFQFSLSTLLATPAFLGFAITAFVMDREWATILALRMLLLAVFGMIVSMLFCGSRRTRAFGTGAAFPAAIGAILSVKPLFSDPTDFSGDWTLAKLTLSNLDDGFQVDLKFRAAFLLTAVLLSGSAGVLFFSAAGETTTNKQ